MFAEKGGVAVGTDWIGFLSVCLSLYAGRRVVGWLAGWLLCKIDRKRENSVFAEAGGVVFGFDWVGWLSVCLQAGA